MIGPLFDLAAVVAVVLIAVLPVWAVSEARGGVR